MWGSQYNAIITWIGDAANIEKTEERNKERTCGTAPKDVINNIYDLYGNSCEWTLEAFHSTLRNDYGGNFKTSDRPVN